MHAWDARSVIWISGGVSGCHLGTFCLGFHRTCGLTASRQNFGSILVNRESLGGMLTRPACVYVYGRGGGRYLHTGGRRTES